MFAELAVVLDLTRLKVKRTFFCSCRQEALPRDYHHNRSLAANVVAEAEELSGISTKNVPLLVIR